MAKNKAKKANARAKKANERARDRQTERAHAAVKFKAKHHRSLAHFTTSLEQGYEFWLLHGINFILSSYEEGIWSPMFPEVYQGLPVTRTDLFKRLLAAHLDKNTNQLSKAGVQATVWASLKPAEMFALVYRAKKAAYAVDADPFAQGQPQVWHFLHEAIEKFAQSIEAKNRTDGGKLTLPVEEYERLLPEAVASTVVNLSGKDSP